MSCLFRVALALLLARGVLPAPWAEAQTPEAGPDLVARGNAALEARRYREAVRLFAEAAAERPESADAHYGLGRALWGPDRLYPISAGRAIQAFTRARDLVAGKDLAFETKVLEALVVPYLRSERVSEARAIYVILIERETRPERIDYMKTQIGEIDLDLGVFPADDLTIKNAQGDILGPIGPNLGAHRAPSRARERLRRAPAVPRGGAHTPGGDRGDPRGVSLFSSASAALAARTRELGPRRLIEMRGARDQKPACRARAGGHPSIISHASRCGSSWSGVNGLPGGR